jgi:hypothetical protein
MATKDEKAQKKLIDLLMNFSKRLILSGYCNWEHIEEKSVDKWENMQSKENKNGKVSTDFIFILQFTNTNLKHFYDGVKKNTEAPKLKIGGYFLRDAEAIKISLVKYTRAHPASINAELWIHEIIRNMSNISGIFTTEVKVDKDEN